MSVWKTIPIAVCATFAIAACDTQPTLNTRLPADAKVTSGQIVNKTHLTDAVVPPLSSGVSAGVGGGGVSGSGIGSGGFFGAGLSFDLSRLFGSHDVSQVAIYRYRVQMQDGTTRDIDSTTDLPADRADQCVEVVESGQPGYPRLRQANTCVR